MPDAGHYQPHYALRRCRAAHTEKRKSVKKSIAVLSLTVAGALGLAACGGNTGGSTSSPSASASASASATASAPASTSAAATSKSTTSAAAETAKAETKTTPGTISTPSSLPSDPAGGANAISGATNNNLMMDIVENFKSLPGVKSTKNNDGEVYYNEEIAYVVAKDGSIIGIQKDGTWNQIGNGKNIIVFKDGGWTMGDTSTNLYTVVKADGTASQLNTKTIQTATDVSTIQAPKAPSRIDGFNGIPVEPVKATKIGDLSEVAGAK